jgi:hypothetical protein
MPTEKFENGAWAHPSRLPLGAGWAGQCTAPGHEGELPAQDCLQSFCNLGYAGGCTWSPQQRVWDAVRFAVVAKRGEKDGSSARRVRVHYVCEQNYLPVEHGDLEFDLASTCLRPHQDIRVQKMAECFLQSYLKKSPDPVAKGIRP